MKSKRYCFHNLSKNDNVKAYKKDQNINNINKS